MTVASGPDATAPVTSSATKEGSDVPRDPRTYITLHDGMPEHHKVEALSDKAFRCLVDLWCWCSRNESDGHVPESVWLKRTNAKARTELLVDLVDPCDGGVVMHDYLEHQRSKA